MKNQALSSAIYGLTTVIGVVACVYPFLNAAIQSTTPDAAPVADAPLLLTALVTLCFVVLLLEVQGPAVNAKFVALLGVLVSINATLRFLEQAIPGPGGFSPIFFLIVLTGYVFGGRFGFLMGALTLLVSALLTGGVGPWLPYQMFAAGWAGLTAPLCRPLLNLGSRVLGFQRQNLEIVVLAIFAGLWGLVYGAILSAALLPFTVGPADAFWEPGLGLGQMLSRYAAFYLATSLAWDVLRVVGNVSLTLAFGAPTLRALRRFQRRFAFTHSRLANLDFGTVAPPNAQIQNPK